MDIRKRLTFQFISIAAIILILSSSAIYFFSADYRENDFTNRLKNKGSNVAKLLIEVEEVDANLLRRIETDNPVSLPEEKVVIYNFKDEEIYSSDEENMLKIDKSFLDKIRLEDEAYQKQGKYEIIGFLYADKYDRFVVIAGAMDIFGWNKLRNLRTILLIVFGVSVILVFFSGWIYAGRALQPISKVVDQVNEISISNIHKRLEERVEQDEITHLSHTFNKMLDRLEAAFKFQKNFIANASHELRTPLTAITGQLEVVLLNERTKDEYKKVISSILDDIKNLNALSNRLLLLAQASTDTTNLEFKPVRIDDLLWQIRNEMIKRNPAYSIEILFDETIDDDSKLSVKGNEQLLKIAFVNLIDNSCKYSDDEKAEVAISYQSKKVQIEFKDRGIGISKDDLKHIFEPFHRGKNAFNQKGHGIGLSLVERIVRSHGGTIRIKSELHTGSSFYLHFTTINFN